VRPIHAPLGPRGGFCLARGLPSRPLDCAPHLRLARGKRTYPRAGKSFLPRSRAANLPSSGQTISASLEATPRHKGQMALPLTRPSYGGFKCQPLLHNAQDRRCQTAISHDGCDRSPIRQLRSLLRHPGRCGDTMGPATRDGVCPALLPALFCQLWPTGLYLIIRMAPDHLLLGRGSGVATSPSERDAHHSRPGARTSPFEGSGTSTCLPDLLVCTTALYPGGPGPPRAPPPLEYARS